MLKIAYSNTFPHLLPPGHRFPMEKYSLIPAQLLHEGSFTEANFFHPKPIDDELILKVHDKEYLEKLKTLSLSKREQRVTGFPLSAGLVQRELEITQGTVSGVDYALQYGASANVAGGTHHAYPGHGEGFCLLNDIAIASHYAIDNLRKKKILVIDLDVHQGNGTAFIFKGDDRVFTFSVHGAKNYPHHKEKSDLDIALDDNTDDNTYLKIVRENIPKLIQSQKPDLIFYLAGVDVLKTDKLGRLALTIDGCKTRDQIVFEEIAKQEIPVVFNMGGGYSERIATIVDAHANTFKVAREVFF
ncbi:histone deacetylase [Cryomorpha ignava]|uniref:Histone deacetylase n=1 Tax=Cryomorpha ignava TaxID=101383 RepID=A0A7K3WLF2_9FLAO|nr:histone deacetylase [Cryomorpha ignava]NEN22459.1 histone deacetylase [Cryomorpha ignava]